MRQCVRPRRRRRRPPRRLGGGHWREVALRCRGCEGGCNAMKRKFVPIPPTQVSTPVSFSPPGERFPRRLVVAAAVPVPDGARGRHLAPLGGRAGAGGDGEGGGAHGQMSRAAEPYTRR